MDRNKKLQGQRALITGGAGFLGSNLAIQLVEYGAQVTIVDNFLPGHGANRFNLAPVMPRVTLNVADIRDACAMNELVLGQDFIFHLAGQVNHVDSLRDPLQDLDINCRGSLVLLEACRKHNPKATVIFTGTRGQYGPSARLPVSEDHPMNPRGMYAITNLTAEKTFQLYHRAHGIASVCLRITNTFGPRHQMRHDEYGVVNWFIRRALSRENIEIMGDGRILRDYIYVDDAVRAILAVACEPSCHGEIYNVGGGAPTSFLDVGRLIQEVAGSGGLSFTEFTHERRALEPGDYVADVAKIGRAVGWAPVIGLRDGLARTIAYYREFRHHYW